jgi:tetratricopeptide (TPR) repeat protein
MINSFNQYLNNSIICDTSSNSNVDDNNNPSESIQGDKISSLSKKRLLLENKDCKPLKKIKLDQSSTVSFSDPENALPRIYQNLQKIMDPFAIEKIIVPGPNGQENVFYIRKMSFAKFSPIYERKISSNSWDKSCIWKKDGDNEDSYYHWKAAGQVVLFVSCQAQDIDPSHYWSISQTLETLKSKEERLTVLEDILILSDLYSIKGLQEECRGYLQAQMTSLQAISDYFDICALLDLSEDFHLEDLWGKAVVSLSEHDLEKVLVLFDELTSQIRGSLPLEKQARAFQVLGKSFALVTKELFKTIKLESDLENKGKIDIEMFFRSACNIYFHFEDSYLNLIPIRDAVMQSCNNHMVCPESFILGLLLLDPRIHGSIDVRDYDLFNGNEGKKIDKTNDLHLIHLGLLHLKESKIEQAFDYFNLALQIRPDRTKLIEHCKVQYFLQKGQFSKALEILDVLQADAHVEVAKGKYFYSQGEKKKALETWNLVLKQDCNDTRALVCRARYFYSEGEHDKALNDLNLALKSDCNNTRALLNRGIYFVKQGEHDKALNDLNLALKIWPTDVSALAVRAHCYSLRKEENKALQDWDLVLQYDPKHVEALRRRSECLLKRSISLYRDSKFDEALKDLEAALDKDPNNFPVIMARGDLFYKKAEWDKAIADFSRILTREPRNSEALGLRGNCYYQKKEWDKAKADFELALDIDPKNNLARAHLPSAHYNYLRYKK